MDLKDVLEKIQQFQGRCHSSDDYYRELGDLESEIEEAIEEADKISKLEELERRASELQLQLDEIAEEAREVTGEQVKAGFTFDYILNGYGTARELLKRFK